MSAGDWFSDEELAEMRAELELEMLADDRLSDEDRQFFIDLQDDES